MENNSLVEERQPTSPRRRRRTKAEIIKESYLPYIFLMAGALICLIFILGAIIRG